MKRFLIISILLSLSIYSGVGAMTSQEKVTAIQGTVSGIPIPPSGEGKGYVGSLLSDIFWATGKIKTIFISAFQDIDTGTYNNTIPRWIKLGTGEGKFTQGTIRDDGINIGIGTGILNTRRVNIAGDVNFTGDLYKNGVLYTPTLPTDIVRTTGDQDVGGIKTFLNTTIFKNTTPGINFIDTDTNAQGSITASSSSGSLAIIADMNGVVAGSRISFSVDTSASTPKMVILGNGNVGIGTVTPEKNLHIKGDEHLLRLENSSGSITDFIKRKGNSTTPDALSIYNLSHGGTWKHGITIDKDGKVGIGTENPSHEFNVVGDINFTGEIYKNGVLLTGDNFGNHSATENIVMNDFKITGLADPTAAQQAATKKYVDDKMGAFSILEKAIPETTACSYGGSAVNLNQAYMTVQNGKFAMKYQYINNSTCEVLTCTRYYTGTWSSCSCVRDTSSCAGSRGPN